MDATTVKIGFLGFGNMASAIADGWLMAGTVPAEHLYACAKRYDALRERTGTRGMQACATAEELVDAVDIVVVAIKPYLIETVLPPLAERLAGKVVVSVAAGWTSERYEAVIPGVHHISTMLNTPVAVCEGLVAFEQANTLTPEEHALITALFEPLGTVVEVETRLMSVAGTIGGCTPAFARPAAPPSAASPSSSAPACARPSSAPSTPSRAKASTFTKALRRGCSAAGMLVRTEELY